MTSSAPAAGFLILLMLSQVAAAPSFDTQETDWRSTPRDGELTLTRDQATWTSPSATENITISYDGPEARLDYRVRALDGGDRSMDMEYGLESLIEFQDLDGDGRLGLGDPVVQQIRFTDMSATPFYVEGGNHTYVEYVRLSQGARVRVDLDFPSDTAPPGEGLYPTEAALRFQVESFHYMSDNMTRLAVATRLLTAVDLRDNAVVHESGRLTGYVAWEDASSGVTLQAYNGQAAPQALLVFSSSRDEPLDQQVVVGALEVPKAGAWSGVFENASLSDWRLWVIGLLVASVIAVVSVARRISRES